MSGIAIGQLHKKKIVRNMNGDIIDWIDETDGGPIIQKGRVVNQAKLDEYAKKQKDRQEAALAQAHAVQSPVQTEDRNVAPSKVDELEKRVSGMEDTLKQILEAVKK